MRPLFIEDGYTESATVQGASFDDFEVSYRPVVGPTMASYVDRIKATETTTAAREIFSEIIAKHCVSIAGKSGIDKSLADKLNDEAAYKIGNLIIGEAKKKDTDAKN